MSHPHFVVGPIEWQQLSGAWNDDVVEWRFSQPIYRVVLDGLMPTLTFPC